MQLIEFIQQQNLSVWAFSRRYEISHSTLRSYLSGLHLPTYDRAQWLKSVTGGAVTQFDDIIRRGHDGRAPRRKGRPAAHEQPEKKMPRVRDEMSDALRMALATFAPDAVYCHRRQTFFCARNPFLLLNWLSVPISADNCWDNPSLPIPMYITPMKRQSYDDEAPQTSQS